MSVRGEGGSLLGGRLLGVHADRITKTGTFNRSVRLVVPDFSLRLLDDRFEDLSQLLFVEGFLVEQALRQVVKDVTVLRQDLPRFTRRVI